MTKQSELVVELYGIQCTHQSFWDFRVSEIWLGRIRIMTLLANYLMSFKSKRRFGMDISAQGHFSTCRRTGTWTFCLHGYFNARTFWHGTFWLKEFLLTWTQDILNPCKVIWTFPQRNFGAYATVPKCPCAEMSPCQNVHGAEKSLGRKVIMLKNPWAEKSLYQNVHGIEMSMCWFYGFML